MNKTMKQSGFTLIELLLVVALMTSVAAISIPVYQRYQSLSDLRAGAVITEQMLHRARGLSQAGAGDSPWGVAISTNQIVLFKGADYATRDVTFDETHNLPTSISATGLSTIIFSKLSGLPSITGTILLSTTNASKTISINSEATISLE
jgi:prepilin-type N-terminal cleavage/methylation domain-containing protein